MSATLSARGAPIIALTTRKKVTTGILVALLISLYIAHKSGLSDYAILPLAAVGLLWVASLLSFATDQLAGHASPGTTGLVQSTVGNAPEGFAVFFLIKAGLLSLALSSLIGSVIVNALLMLGCVYLIGTIRQGGKMTFNPHIGNDAVKMISFVVMTVALIAIAEHSGYMTNEQGDHLSLLAAIIILIVYIIMLVVHARAHHELEESTTPVLSMRTTLILMLIGGVGAAVGADLLVASLEPVVKSVGISEDFVGFIFVAVVGNASENLGAFAQVWKGNNDVAVAMIKHSAAQVAAGLLPLMIIISWIVGNHLSFTMPPIYLAALALAPLAIFLTSADGEAQVHEGAFIVGMYLILAALLLFAG